MSKHFDKSKFVHKLPKDDPECVYVNNMMEMPSDLLRELCKAGESYDKLHGIVPKCKLPAGYNYGRIPHIHTQQYGFDQKENKNVKSSSQKSSNSNSTLRMEIDDTNSSDEKKITAIDIVSRDIHLSSEEEDRDNENNEESLDCSKEESEKIFETLNKCSSKLPRVEPISFFQKHYGNCQTDNRTINNIQNSKKVPSDDASCTGDTEPFEDSNESVKSNPQVIMKFIELLSSSKPEIKVSTFESVCNAINRKRKAMKMQDEETMISKPKISKYMVEKMDNSMELRIKIIPELVKDFNIKGAIEAFKKRQLSKETKSSNSTIRPNYTTQESLPFAKSEKKRDDKSSDKCSTSSNTQKLFSNSPSGDDGSTNKKPQATAKQIFPQSSNIPNYCNSTNVACMFPVSHVTGKINKAPLSLQNTNSTTNTPLPNQQLIFQSNHHKTQQSTKSLYIKEENQRNFNSNDNEADELKVVQGLIAIEKLRTSVKNEFMNRMRALDTEKWLREADGHKENAENVKGKLEYQPMIILAVRKYLIYNYSLDVKEESKKCFENYLHNGDFVCSIIENLNQIYKNHMKQITDPNNPRLWNLNLIRWFSITMCLKIKAILQYRAFRNVAMHCKRINTKLRNLGVIDNDGKTNFMLSDNSQSINLFDGLRGYSPGRNSTSNFSPAAATPVNYRSSTNNTGINSTLTLPSDTKADLLQYIEDTRIVNSAYIDWLAAERNQANFCGQGLKFEEAWKDMEWRVIEKTGGITINSIDESMPFVIKYLEGFINYMGEFQKLVVAPRSSDSRMIS